MEYRGEMPYRKLGKTGEKVSLIGLGGYHLGFPTLDEGESIEIIRTALDNGINFMDCSWDYNDGLSELRMGKALRGGYRQKAFLMTKFDGQTKELAKRQFEESLERLQVDYVDLLQFHEIARLDDADYIFGPDGSIEFALQARESGLTRYIGFAGHHSPDAHLKMLETAAGYGFTFDTVLMPLNVMDPHFSDWSFEKKVLPVLLEQGAGVIAIKSLGDGSILRSNLVNPVECMQYVMNLPVSTVLAGCESMADLRQALEVARTFRPLSPELISGLLGRTAKAGANGEFEPYKTKMTSEMHYWMVHPEWWRPV